MADHAIDSMGDILKSEYSPQEAQPRVWSQAWNIARHDFKILHQTGFSSISVAWPRRENSQRLCLSCLSLIIAQPSLDHYHMSVQSYNVAHSEFYRTMRIMNIRSVWQQALNSQERRIVFLQDLRVYQHDIVIYSWLDPYYRF